MKKRIIKKYAGQRALVFNLLLFLAGLCISTLTYGRNEAALWRQYINAKVQIAPSYLFLTAYHRYFTHAQKDGQRRAFDIGSGSGNEDVYLLNRGWDVTGLDSNAYSGVVIGKRAEGLPGHFTFEHATFNHMQLTGHYDLMLSLLSLPFGQKQNLPTIIHRVAQHLTPGGIFVFNLFGPNATMARNKRVYAMNRNAITTLLNKNGLRITFILHRQFTTRDMAGDKQFLDLYDVIAAKPKRITRCECPGPGCPDPMGVLALNTKRDSTVLAEFTRSGAFNK